MSADPKADAALAVLVDICFDMTTLRLADLAPHPDPRLADWFILGYITARQAVFSPQKRLTVSLARTCYGFLARSKIDPNQFISVIRGTAGILAWIEDAEFGLTPHPAGGRVETGFWSIYSTMTYTPIGGVERPLTDIAAEVTGNLTVIGHSLGSPLSSYLAHDLAPLLGDRLRARLFASPRPGDAVYAAHFTAAVPDAVIYNYTLDIVPKVPWGLGYCPLPGVFEVTTDEAEARICLDPSCWHHVIVYASLMNYALMDWQAVPAMDKPLVACIKGPRLKVAAT